MSDPIQVQDLRVRYGDVLALDGVDLTVGGGVVHGLVGMNGSGKSTLFKAIMGIVRPTTGDVRLFGERGDRSRRAGRVAYAPQSEAVDWDFPVSVADVVLMGRYHRMGLRRRASDADRRAVDEALERVQLADLRDRQIGALSGGQRKRAFVGRALAQGADLLLMDEPFAGVDKRSEQLLTELLRDLVAEGRTVLVSTHDLIGIPGLCDRVTLLNRRVVATGEPAEVLRPGLLADAFGGFVPASALEVAA